MLFNYGIFIFCLLSFLFLVRHQIRLHIVRSTVPYKEDPMYHKEKSIQIKNSASALYNNLSVLRIAPRRLTHFTVVHANMVNMVSASWDGLNYTHRQLQSKEPNVATSTSLIMQVRSRCNFFCSPFYLIILTENS